MVIKESEVKSKSVCSPCIGAASKASVRPMSIQSGFPLGLTGLISDHFKVFIKFVTILLLFYVLVFGHEVCGILAS